MEDEDSNQEKKPTRTSKLSALISENENQNETSPGISINVCYSENNYETCEVVQIMIEENTTVEELINSAKYKLKNELSYNKVDEKNFDLMLFKKKIKKPNYNYPKCNPKSLVKDYAKTFFCLIESETKTETNDAINNKKNSDDKFLSSESNENFDEIKKQVEQTKKSNEKIENKDDEKINSNFSFQKCCCGCGIF